jgi:hypothetical protein
MPSKSMRMRSKSKRMQSKRSSSKRMQSKRMQSKRMQSKRMQSKRSSSKRMQSKHMHRKNRTRRHKKTMKRSRRRMYGGSGAPSPWVGSPYFASDRNPSGNFLPLSQEYGVPSGLPVPPVSTSPQFGGKRSRHGRQRGGGFTDNLSTFVSTVVPEDLLNAGRYIPAAAGNLMDRFNGLIPSASSQVYPTQQPLALSTQQASSNVSPPDVNAAYNRAISSVQSM